MKLFLLFATCSGYRLYQNVNLETGETDVQAESLNDEFHRIVKRHTCSSILHVSPLYGGHGGHWFSDEDMYLLRGNPTHFSLYCGSRLDSIQVSYGRNWAVKHGGDGGTQKIFGVQKGGIERIRINAGSEVDGIEFFWATGGRSAYCGAKGGTKYEDSAHGCTMAFINGRAGSKIDALQFVWNC
jgi:hypothetical protein